MELNHIIYGKMDFYLVKKKGWTEMFCPKLITLEKYKFHGPFDSESKMIHFSKNYINKCSSFC